MGRLGLKALGAVIFLAAGLLLATCPLAPTLAVGTAATAGVVNVSKTSDTAEGEVPLAVDPVNPSHVAAASNSWAPTLPSPADQTPSVNGLMMSAVYTSRDGGHTWLTSRPDQGGVGRVANPLALVPGSPAAFQDLGNIDTTDADVAFDRHGNLYFMSGAAHNPSHNFDEVATVWRSTDAGLTWLPPSTAVTVLRQEHDELDRPWLAVDNSGGPRDGDVYLSFETGAFTDDPPMVLVKRSDDHGLTWGPTVRVDDGTYETQFNPRARPVVGAGGTLYIAYDRSPISNTPFNSQVAPIQLVVARSNDGGTTFARTVAEPNVTRVTSPDEALGSSYSEMISAIAADQAHPGRVAVVWPEAVSPANSRVLARVSVDGGVTWGPRVDVADDPAALSNQHDHVTARFSPDGRLAVGWRDRRASGGAWTGTFDEYVRLLQPTAGGGLAPLGGAVMFTDSPQPPEAGFKGPTMPDEFQGLAVADDSVMLTWVQPVGAYTDLMFRAVSIDRFRTVSADRFTPAPAGVSAASRGLPNTSRPNSVSAIAAALFFLGMALALQSLRARVIGAGGPSRR